MKPTIRYWYNVTYKDHYDGGNGDDNYTTAKRMADHAALSLYLDALYYGDDTYLGEWIEVVSYLMYPDGSTTDTCDDSGHYYVRVDPDDGELEWNDNGPGDDDGEPDDYGMYDDWLDAHLDWLREHPEIDAYAEYFCDDE
nr:MAG TPA: hypothetical protein [Caudoviricetes sp.]